MKTSNQKKPNSLNAPITQNDRLKLVEGLINLYATHNSVHGKNEQSQFSVLICAYWADMPKKLQHECIAKLANRSDITAELKEKFSSTLSVNNNYTTTSQRSTQSIKVKLQNPAPHIPVWWRQSALFFDMKFEARIQAVADLEHLNVPYYPLPSLPENELRDVKNFYFAGNEKEVLEALQNSLNISQLIFKTAMDDKDLIGLCILFKSLGFESKDMTSFIIFNSAKLGNPSSDAFARAKWIETIPQITLSKIIQFWQNEPVTLFNNTIKTPIKPARSKAISLQNTVKKALGSKNKIPLPVQDQLKAKKIPNSNKTPITINIKEKNVKIPNKVKALETTKSIHNNKLSKTTKPEITKIKNKEIQENLVQQKTLKVKKENISVTKPDNRKPIGKKPSAKPKIEKANAVEISKFKKNDQIIKKSESTKTSNIGKIKKIKNNITIPESQKVLSKKSTNTQHNSLKLKEATIEKKIEKNPKSPQIEKKMRGIL